MSELKLNVVASSILIQINSLRVLIHITHFPVRLSNLKPFWLKVSSHCFPVEFALRRKEEEGGEGKKEEESWTRRRNRINRATDGGVTTGSGSCYLITSCVKIT